MSNAIRVVLDTNVLVSALLSPENKPARVLGLIQSGQVVPCYDSRILLEYENVLSRKKFPFAARDISILPETISKTGMAFVPAPADAIFSDEGDKKFYETAKEAGAWLVTGSIKHFPCETWIVTPADFLVLQK